MNVSRKRKREGRGGGLRQVSIVAEMGIWATTSDKSESTLRKGGNSSARSDSGVEGVEVSQGLDHLESQPPLTQPHPPSIPGSRLRVLREIQLTRTKRHTGSKIRTLSPSTNKRSQ